MSIRSLFRLQSLATIGLGCAVAVGAASCGGGGGSGAAGGSLALVSFEQDSVDNVALNQVLEFIFTDPVDEASIIDRSFQLREGPGFGLGVVGTTRVEGNRVFFEPQLPGLCSLVDAGFKPGTTYRVQLVGWPEEYAVENLSGQPLLNTMTFEFQTRAEEDPERFLDQIPGFVPIVQGISPANGDAAVTVDSSNRIVITVSENIDPCTVSTDTVRFHVVETGDPVLANGKTAANGNLSGFYRGLLTTDGSASSFSWGADVYTTIDPPQQILADIRLEQTVALTQIVVTPTFGRFPENALLLLRMTSGITDFGGLPLAPLTISFTTQNLPPQFSQYNMLAEGETPFDAGATTAQVNTVGAPSRIQGYLLFAGDGDNGLPAQLNTASGPDTPASGCSIPRQGNDGQKDDFDPAVDTVLDGGATLNTCLNNTDGSTAVEFEFRTFRIRAGVTVRAIGPTPIIVKSQGDVLIENGGRLMARGDNQGGAPQGIGANGNTNSIGVLGGRGMAGGGNGGNSVDAAGTEGIYGEDGQAGFGSPNQFIHGGLGGGEGNVMLRRTTFAGQEGGNSAAGGGGGHASVGTQGAQVENVNSPFFGDTRGAGGGVYPVNGNPMRTPSAGSGGGAGGGSDMTVQPGNTYDSSGGAGGAGGGFVDFTSQGNILIFGQIDANGSRGGNGNLPASAGNFYNGSAGGGGGSGGGIRLLTPGLIDVAGGILTTSGGAGGAGAVMSAAGGPSNAGGPGGHGRLVMEDGDSLISGVATATLVPAEGAADGFWRDQFDATRFVGGGLEPTAVSGIFAVGPQNPVFQTPVQSDFVAGIPVIGSRGFQAAAILIEAQGYQNDTAGDANLATATGWKTVGYFRDSGSETAPQWIANALPPDVPFPPPDNTGGTIMSLNTCEFIQIRVTIYLPASIGPFDAGPYLDTWRIRFSFDQ